HQALGRLVLADAQRVLEEARRERPLRRDRDARSAPRHHELPDPEHVAGQRDREHQGAQGVVRGGRRQLVHRRGSTPARRYALPRRQRCVKSSHYLLTRLLSNIRLHRPTISKNLKIGVPPSAGFAFPESGPWTESTRRLLLRRHLPRRTP